MNEPVLTQEQEPKVKEFIESLKKSLLEIRKIKSGELKAMSAESLLDEL